MTSSKTKQVCIEREEGDVYFIKPSSMNSGFRQMLSTDIQGALQTLLDKRLLPFLCLYVFNVFITCFRKAPLLDMLWVCCYYIYPSFN